jgi:hypothetical protein
MEPGSASNNGQDIQVATDANGRPATSDFIGSDGVAVTGAIIWLRKRRAKLATERRASPACAEAS